MYESKTYETIMSQCLALVSSDLDTREGSVIYDALAPACAQLAIFYTELSTLLDRAFPDTAVGEDLDRKVAERGMSRQQATCAQREAVFLDDSGNTFTVAENSRFYGGNIVYVLSDSQQAIVTAETAGEAGNGEETTLLPLEYHAGLASATLGAVVIAGEEEEDDETLRARYFASFESQSFGGNIADYQTRTEAMDGVGGAKIERSTSGDGELDVILVGSDWLTASDTLVEQVQTALDPTVNQGEGVGLAPIGHCVTVRAATDYAITVGLSLTLEDDTSWSNLEDSIVATLEAYFTELIQGWSKTSALIVRINQIETRILEISGVVDMENTKLNGVAKNLTLDVDEIPFLEEVVAL